MIGALNQLIGWLVLGCSLSSATWADVPAALPNDTVPASRDPPVLALPAHASPHWIWVNDFDFFHMASGKALLIDGDTGRFLGQLDTGFAALRIVPSADGRSLYSAETYFSRGTRGTRTDVITIYDASSLAPRAEIAIPAKRSSNLPMMGNLDLTDDGAFLLVYNFTPAQSVSVIDVRARTFAAEADISGCALIFPTGPRSFFSLCADGALLVTRLGENGQTLGTERTQPLFDVDQDPVTEKPVRLAKTWYFVTFSGRILGITASGTAVRAAPTWSLLTPEERAQGWRPGGLQQFAAHAGRKRLYAIMHQGPLSTHKDPGPEVWVYDVEEHRRLARFELRRAASSIQVSQDGQPLLFCASLAHPDIEVYDALTGLFQRSIADVASTPTVLVTPQRTPLEGGAE